MGFKLFDPNPYPSVNMKTTLGFKILTSNFGDNYSQRAGDGINAMADEITAAWDDLTMAEFNTIFSFIKAQSGVRPFYFIQPNASFWQKFVCNSNIARTYANGQTASLQLTFTEVFDVDGNVASSYGGVPPSALYNSAGVPVVDAFGNYVLTS